MAYVLNGKTVDEATFRGDPAEAERRFRDMVVSGRGPTLVTDATFLAGHCNGSQFGGGGAQEEIGNYYKRVAERHGQNVKGKVYKSQLADFPGDPRAWVDGRGDVQRLCEERGDGCDGSVKVKRNDNGWEPEPEVAVAPDIVNREVAEIIAREPRRALKREEVVDEVVRKRKPHWKK